MKNAPYVVVGRKIYEQTDHEDIYRMVEKDAEVRFGNNLHINTLKQYGAKEFQTFGEARLEARSYG